MQSSSQQNYSSYIFSTVSDHERLALQHGLFKPGFVQIVEQALDKYGLADKLEQAKTTRDKVYFLDVGCAEGLYLFDLAEVLESRGLIDAADLSGMDIDEVAISTAEQFSQLSNPPRPYLNFYLHDVTTSFERHPVLRVENKFQFDFIYAIAVLTHLPDAQKHLERLYQSLKPGGVIYLCDMIFKEKTKANRLEEGTDDEDGWIAPHPAMTPIYRTLFSFVQSKNPGVEVAKASAGWLKELGAEVMLTRKNVIWSGGDTKDGMNLLRNGLMIIRNATPGLIAQNLLTQSQVDETMAVLFRELSPASIGCTLNIETVARKPL